MSLHFSGSTFFSRLLIEILLILSVVEIAIMHLLNLGGLHLAGWQESLFDAVALALIAGPLILWRSIRHIRAGAESLSCSGKRRSALLLVLPLLVLGCVGTGLGGWIEYQHVLEEATGRFERESDRVSRDVVQRFSSPGYGLNAVRGLFASGQKVGREEFQRYVASHDLPDEYGGMRGLGFIERVSREDLSAFELAERRDQAADFKVKTSGDAPDLFVVKYIEPLAKNRPAWGYDIGSEAIRRIAAEQAIASGKPTLTGKITLLQDDRKTPGFLLLLPVYRNGSSPDTPIARRDALQGLVFTPIVVDELLDGLLGAGNTLIDIDIFDGDEQSHSLVYDADRHQLAANAGDVYEGRLFVRRSKVEIGQRKLLIVTSSKPEFERTVNFVQIGVMVLGGLLITQLLSVSVWTLLRRRDQAEEMARAMTEDLRLANARTEAALRESQALHRSMRQHAIVSVATRDGRITEVNDAFCKISGYSREELIGQDHRIVNSGVQSREFWLEMWRTIASGQPWRGVICNRAKSGQLYWVESLIAPVTDERGEVEKYVSIRFDITASKEASAQLVLERERLANILAATRAGTWEWNIQTGETRFNARWAEIIGYQLDELQPTTIATWARFAHPVDLGRSAQLLEKHFDGQTDFYAAEARMQHRDGSWVWVMDRGRLISRTANGEPEWMAGTHIDITPIKRVEEALTRERNLFVGGPVVAFSWALEDGWPVLEVSGNVAMVLGTPQSDWIASRFIDRIHPDDRLQIRSEVAQHLAINADSWEHHYRLKHADGSYRHVYDYTQSVRDDLGKIMGVRGYLLDLTEQKEAESALRHTSTLLSGVLDAATEVSIIATNPQGTIVVFNRGAEQLLGYRADEMVGIQTPAILHDPDEVLKRGAELSVLLGHPVTGFDVFVALANQGENEEREWTYVRKDGSRFTVSLIVSAMRNELGEIQGYLGIGHDVTRAKEYEQQLQMARQKAEMANVAKSAFLANMSHEIRTPMNGVIGMTSLLLDTELSEEQHRSAEIIRSSAESLLGIINDILDFSKIEAGKLDIETIDFDLQMLVDDFSSALAFKAQEKGLDFVCALAADVPTQVRGDPGRLRQILTNLVGNAIKFTAMGGSVSMRVERVLQSDDDAVLRFVVRDSGVGIAKAKQGDLFKSFSQLDASTTRKYGGTGLGLAISRQLAELMGGEIGVDSEEGQGATFWFTVRLGLQHQRAQEWVLPADLHHERALIVDEHPVNRDVIAGYLSEWGMPVSLAEDGAKALALLREAADAGQPFRLVILDMMMADMDCTAFSAALKLEEKLAGTRLVLMTSMVQRGDAKRFEALGFAAYLPKPVRRSELFDCLALTLARNSTAGAQPIVTRHLAREQLVPTQFKGRVLLAEDNLVNQKVALAMLTKLGIEVVLVDNGQEALDALAREQFDLVLMDMQMPVMDGLEATRRIRNPQSSVLQHDLPVIALTANAMLEDQLECKEAGMDAFLAKPLSAQSLADTLRQWLD